jgi:hypothetical protein
MEHHSFFKGKSSLFRFFEMGHEWPWPLGPPLGQGRMASAMTQLKMVLLRHAPRKKSWVNW